MEIHSHPHIEPRMIMGVDLGQTHDPTAIAIAQREMVVGIAGRLEPRFLVRFLERVPLRTAYPEVVRGVRRRLTALGEPCSLVVDATGVGRGVVDLFKEPVSAEVQEEEAQYHPKWRLARTLDPIAVTLTAGHQARQESWWQWYVAKQIVVMSLQVALQQGRVQVASGLADAQTLVREAQNFRWRPTKAGNDEYGAWREGQHDDLLLAVAMLVWWGDRFAPVATTGQGAQRYAISTGNMLRKRSPHRNTVGARGR